MKAALSSFLLLTACYLTGDFFVFHGPFHRWLKPRPADLAAQVAGQPITHSQVERVLNERLWLEGKSINHLLPAELTLARKAALDELIDHELLRLHVASISPAISVADSEIDERLRRLVGRFETKGTLETAMKTQGIPSERNLRERLATQIRLEKWLTQQLAPATQVTEEEAHEWFAKNQAVVSLPERIEVRHIFIPTLDYSQEEAKRRLDEALVALTERKKDFATLAKEVSEDPATKDTGGMLGWMTADRLPKDFAAPVFNLGVNQPKLIRTKLGWHLVEITRRMPAESSNFERMKVEIITALQAVKTRQATEDFRTTLRKSFSDQIHFYR